MNLLGTTRATRNEQFVDRVKAAIVLTAQDILNDPDTIGLRRHFAAQGVMEQPDHHMWITQFVWKCAANAAIANTVQSDGTVNATDADIHDVVSGAWDTLFAELPPATP